MELILLPTSPDLVPSPSIYRKNVVLPIIEEIIPSLLVKSRINVIWTEWIYFGPVSHGFLDKYICTLFICFFLFNVRRLESGDWRVPCLWTSPPTSHQEKPVLWPWPIQSMYKKYKYNNNLLRSAGAGDLAEQSLSIRTFWHLAYLTLKLCYERPFKAMLQNWVKLKV